MEKPQQQTEEKQDPQLRGLYKHVKISVTALNWIIVICIAAILLVVALEMADPGYTVSFDTKGGTDVVSQEREYGDLLVLPEQPVREGYVFTGWYKDSGCYEPWDLEKDTVQTDTVLYAGWEKTE